MTKAERKQEQLENTLQAFTELLRRRPVRETDMIEWVRDTLALDKLTREKLRAIEFLVDHIPYDEEK